MGTCHSAWLRRIGVVMAAFLAAALIPVGSAMAQLTTPEHFQNGNATSRCIGLSRDWAGDWTCVPFASSLDQWWNPLFQQTVYSKDVTLNVNVNGTMVKYTQTNVAFYPWRNQNSRCLAVDAGRTNSGARIRGWDCTYTPDQYWGQVSLPFMPHGYFYLVNGKSNLVAGVSSSSTANGATVVQFDPYAHSDQYWHF